MTQQKHKRHPGRLLAGVDGYKNGWIAAVDLGDGNTEVRTFPTFNSLLDAERMAQIVIDIPIGLLDRGSRACDVEARRFLGRGRRSSVFPAPIRAMLKANNWEEACRIQYELEAKKCSKQTAAILPKIREVDEEITPALQRRIREGHPEVSFAMMNNGRAMTFPKRTTQGKAERLTLLAQYFPDLTVHLSAVPGASTDILDAYACLWTARRIVSGQAVCFPAGKERDRLGLAAEIVA